MGSAVRYVHTPATAARGDVLDPGLVNLDAYPTGEDHTVDGDPDQVYWYIPGSRDALSASHDSPSASGANRRGTPERAAIVRSPLQGNDGTGGSSGDGSRCDHRFPGARTKRKSYSSLIVSATLSTTGTRGCSSPMSLKVKAVVAVPATS